MLNGRNPFHAGEVGTSVHDYLGLARAGTGQYEHVVVGGSLYNRLLVRIA